MILGLQEVDNKKGLDVQETFWRIIFLRKKKKDRDPKELKRTFYLDGSLKVMKIAGREGIKGRGLKLQFSLRMFQPGDGKS